MTLILSIDLNTCRKNAEGAVTKSLMNRCAEKHEDCQKTSTYLDLQKIFFQTKKYAICR